MFRTSAKVRGTKSSRIFFATNAPDPPHWTLNSCFGAFRTIWVHLGLFGCLTKLGAKRAELVQKFVPRSGIGIFCDERTRSAPYDPKLMFWCVSYHLGAFGTVRMPYETRGKIGRTCKSSCHEVAAEFSAMNPLDPLYWSLNSCFGLFRTVWVFLRPFGCLTKLGAKRSDLVQKFVPRCRVGIFGNESTRSTPWDPKLMFWCIS